MENINTSAVVYSTAEKMKYVSSRHRYFESLVFMALIDWPQDRIPKLVITDKDKVYTDRVTIQIGVENLMAEGDTKEEAEYMLFMQVYYLIGHEVQHLLSTTERDWETAHRKGEREICKQLAEDVLHTKLKLVKEDDIIDFYKDLWRHSVNVDRSFLTMLVHFVLNSLEDGRIERIRSGKKPGFFKYMKYFRGLLWERTAIDGLSPENISKTQEMYIVLNQILSLATTGNYQRGFLKAFGGSEVYKRVNVLIPTISRAVMASSCRECMKYAVDVLMEIKDIIVAAILHNAEEADKMLQGLLKAIIESVSDNEFSAKSSTEEKGDSSTLGKSVFGNSVLSITLPDEEYDELMKKLKDSPQDNEEGDALLQILREHPKEEDNPAEECSGTSDSGSAPNSSQSEGKNTSSEKSSGSGGENNEGKTSSETRVNAPGGSDEGTEEEDFSEVADPYNDNTVQENPHGGSQSVQTNKRDASDNESSNELEDSKKKQSGSFSKGGCKDNGLSDEEITEKVRKAMKDAAKSCNADINLAEQDLKRQEDFKNAMKNFKSSVSSPIDTSAIDAEYSVDVSFSEEVRAYFPNLMLPISLEEQGNSLKRKIQEIVGRRRLPSRRGQRSGKIDGTRLHKMLSGDFSIYKRPGEEDIPDIAGYILIDNSGSMGNGPGSTRYAACEAVSVIEEGFKHIMPLKVAAFDAASWNSVTHEVIKDFDEQEICNYTYNFCLQGRSGFGNKDGYSIRVATEQLSQRHEQDKVLIVVSDGLPSDYIGGYDAGIADVHNAVLEARKRGIKVIGLYTYSYADEETFGQYEQMYETDYIMVPHEEIMDELVRRMKGLFIS